MYMFEKDLMQDIEKVKPDLLFIRAGDRFEGWADFNRKYGESAGVRLSGESDVQNYLARIGLFFEKEEELFIIKETDDETGKLLYGYYLDKNEPVIASYTSSWKGNNREYINIFLRQQPWLEAEGRLSHSKYGLSNSVASSLWIAKPETNLYIKEEVEVNVVVPDDSQWTILRQYRVRGLNNPSRVDIQCSCGKTMKMYVASDLSRSINCQSCARRIIDFEKFYSSIQQEGYTIIQNFQDSRPTALSKILLQCPRKCVVYETCQNIWVNMGNRCPGCSFSVGEKKVAQYLDEKGIKYRSQVKFNELTGIGGGRLSYDFEVELNEEKVLIEIDGGQHFKSVDHFGGDEVYQRNVEHDRRKTDFAVRNNLRLVRIQNTNSDYDFIIESLESILSGSDINYYGSLY